MVEATTSVARNIAEIIDLDQAAHTINQKMVRSKYGMMEIFRAGFFKRDAILLMRLLNKKFRALSNDKYLD